MLKYRTGCANKFWSEIIWIQLLWDFQRSILRTILFSIVSSWKLIIAICDFSEKKYFWKILISIKMCFQFYNFRQFTQSWIRSRKDQITTSTAKVHAPELVGSPCTFTNLTCYIIQVIQGFIPQNFHLRLCRFFLLTFQTSKKHCPHQRVPYH